jgi:hypothetical protein
MYIGVVRPRLHCNRSHAFSNDAFFVSVVGGTLRGRWTNDEQPCPHDDINFKVGDTVGVLLQLRRAAAAGRIRFFVNGKEHGRGFKGGINGPLALGVQLLHPDHSVELLSRTKMPAYLEK